MALYFSIQPKLIIFHEHFNVILKLESAEMERLTVMGKVWLVNHAKVIFKSALLISNLIKSLVGIQQQYLLKCVQQHQPVLQITIFCNGNTERGSPAELGYTVKKIRIHPGDCWFFSSQKNGFFLKMLIFKNEKWNIFMWIVFNFGMEMVFFMQCWQFFCFKSFDLHDGYFFFALLKAHLLLKQFFLHTRTKN